jgi:hypothetical protein
MTLTISGNDSLQFGITPEYSDSEMENELFTDFDKFSLEIKCIYIIISTLVITINVLAMVVLRRTKKIPYASKFLCTGILLYDLNFVVVSTIRKFIKYPATNLAFQVFGSVSYHLSLISVMMMSVERFLLFYYPMRYLRIVSEKMTRVVILSTWSLYVASFVIVRYGVCYLRLKSEKVFVQAGACNNIILTHLGICLLIVTTVSCICNWKILRLIQSKKYRSNGGLSLSSTRSILTYYKSTGLVLTCLIVLLLTGFAYGTIIIAVRYFDVGVLYLRISFEGVSTVNSLIDPVLYIMWFKECQMEVMKMFACLNRKLHQKAEEMRIEIFCIVVSESFTRSRNTFDSSDV